MALRALAPSRADGRWAGFESAIICGRQNLKTWALEMVVISDVWERGVKRATWTSHRYKTTQQAFGDILALVDNYDWLRKRVNKVRTAKGEEGFELLSGSRLDFLARSAGGGRGLTGDTVALDEALFLSPVMMGALIPTLSSRPNPHVLYGSSPGVLDSSVLRSIRDRGRTGTDPSLSYIEWSSPREPCPDPDCMHLPETPGCLLDDEAKWAQANPALGRRISVDYVRSERRALPPSEFMRERLGWWEDPPTLAEDQVIPAEAWADRLDAGSAIPDGSQVAFAIDTSWDRQTTWIAACGNRPDGVPHVEVVASGYGTDWVVGWLAERLPAWKVRAIGLQGSGSPVSSLLDPLSKTFGTLVVNLSGTDLGRACGSFFDAVTTGPLAHTGQAQLDVAVQRAVVRPIGDAWVWDRKGAAVDIAPLVAVTEALYLLTTVPEPKPRGRARGF